MGSKIWRLKFLLTKLGSAKAKYIFLALIIGSLIGFYLAKSPRISLIFACSFILSTGVWYWFRRK